MLPISSLVGPPDPLLIRNTNKEFIRSLKQEMLKNPTTDVQPILCLVSLKDGETFIERYKEGYKYHTIGGNHSRQAIQELQMSILTCNKSTYILIDYALSTHNYQKP